MEVTLNRSDWEHYSRQAMRTRNLNLTVSETLENVRLGLFGEAGELCEIAKKRRFHGRSDNDPLKEIGNLFWYLALGYEIGYVAFGPPGIDSVRWTAGGIFPTDKGERDRKASAAIQTLAHRAIEPSPTLERIASTADYVARLYGSTLAGALSANIEKLKARYPEGFRAGKGADR